MKTLLLLGAMLIALSLFTATTQTKGPSCYAIVDGWSISTATYGNTISATVSATGFASVEVQRWNGYGWEGLFTSYSPGFTVPIGYSYRAIVRSSHVCARTFTF
jgi:hypothetical protein